MINLGLVPFLNAKPLVYPLETGLVDHGFNILYFNPSTLSKKLREKKVDVGLIPAAEFLKNGNYRAFPNISISSYGKVDSVVLLSKKELKKIKSVAIDSRSQSSTALLKIILEIFSGIQPTYFKRDIDDSFLVDVDAGMLIGNSGLKALCSDNNEFLIYDLGELWTQNTGLPFVYAVFAFYKGYDPGSVYETLLKSKNIGVGIISEIVEGEFQKLGLSKHQCELYLSERIKFDLDEEKINGLNEYQKLLFELGEIDKIIEIEFYEK